MGCEPLACFPVESHLPPCLTQRTPCPETLASLLNKRSRQPCSVSTWPGPACLPSTLKLGMLAKQNLLPGLSSCGVLGCSEQGLGAKISGSFGSDFPRPATTGPRNSSSRHRLHWHTFVNAPAGSRVWGFPFRGLCSPAADYSSLLLSNGFA
eukprot:1075696-Pelagomonas_calceolata.AAC.6